MSTIEERIQDQVSSPNDCGRKITNFLWANTDNDVEYLLDGITRIKDFFWPARNMQKDVLILKMDIVWFKVLDYALLVFKDKLEEGKMMTPGLLRKIRDLQAQEPGVKALAVQRFGEEKGMTEDAKDRVWI